MGTWLKGGPCKIITETSGAMWIAGGNPHHEGMAATGIRFHPEFRSGQQDILHRAGKAYPGLLYGGEAAHGVQEKKRWQERGEESQHNLSGSPVKTSPRTHKMPQRSRDGAVRSQHQMIHPTAS